jgi:hypothetical protein
MAALSFTQDGDVSTGMLSRQPIVATAPTPAPVYTPAPTPAPAANRTTSSLFADFFPQLNTPAVPNIPLQSAPVVPVAPAVPVMPTPVAPTAITPPAAFMPTTAPVVPTTKPNADYVRMLQDFVKEGGETGANASLKLAEIGLSPTGTPLEQQQATIAEPNADYVRMLSRLC